METRLSIPKNWPDFEMLCHQLWKEVWGDHNAQLHGRRGQGQAGVDIWGEPTWGVGYAGVQCKDKDGRLGSELKPGELEQEAAHAINFSPTLREFTMATTAPRDAAIQKHARELNEAGVLPFEIHVWSWDDIEAEIRSRPNLQSAFYPERSAPLDEQRQMVLSLFAQRDYLHAFFSRPAVVHSLSGELRQFVLPMVYEVADNSFTHGNATLFKIDCSPGLITLADDGVPFNPLIQLQAEPSVRAGIGTMVIKTFIRRFDQHLTGEYKRDCDMNRLSLRFDSAIVSSAQPTPVEIPVHLGTMGNRRAARSLSASLEIPRGAREVLLNIIDIGPISSGVEFIFHVLQRLGPEASLIVSAPRNPYLVGVEAMFKDPRLKIIFR